MAYIQGDNNVTAGWVKRNMKDTSRRNFATKFIPIQTKKTPKEIAIEEESKIRKELQNYIIKKLKEGKDKEEILKRLKFVYRDQRYQTYYKYFDGWIDHFMAKINSDNREER